MYKLKTLIVDDELLARTSLERLCAKTNNIEYVASCQNAEEALHILAERDVDLLLLDIEMPGLSGIELLDQLPSLPIVIFTTSKTEYAYEAYEYDVTDFLKKPVTSVRFMKAIEKAAKLQDQLHAVAKSSAEKELYVKSDGRLVRVAYDDIYYFENVGDYIKIITTSITHVIHGTIKALDQRLTHPRFLKIHRSFIINLDKIKDIEDGNVVINKKMIPISRSHKSILLKSIHII